MSNFYYKGVGISKLTSYVWGFKRHKYKVLTWLLGFDPDICTIVSKAKLFISLIRKYISDECSMVKSCEARDHAISAMNNFYISVVFLSAVIKLLSHAFIL